MSRHLYWIIMLPDGPTAFRANTADELAPTLKQLQRAQPNAQIMWFERNRLWRSPGHARQVLEEERAAARLRSRGWRPGGDHKDPRAVHQLTREQKRKRFLRKWQEEDAERAAREGGARGPGSKPGGRPDRPPGQRRPAAGGSGWKPSSSEGSRGRGPTPARTDRRPTFKAPFNRSGPPAGGAPGGAGQSRPRGSGHAGRAPGRTPGGRPTGGGAGTDRRPGPDSRRRPGPGGKGGGGKG